MSELSKPLIIYHGNCADGFTAAWVMRKFLMNRSGLNEEVDVYPGTYQTDPPDVTDREVFMVDFSYKRPVVEKMLSTARSLVWIDHHKSAIEDLDGLKDHYDNFYPYTSLDHSGAMLAWKWCYDDDEPPYVLKHVEARDLWKFLPGTREVTAVVFSYEYTFENWDILMGMDGTTAQTVLLVQGESIERKHHKDVAEINKACAFRMNIGGHNVPVVNVPSSTGMGWMLDAQNVFASWFTFDEEFMVMSQDNLEVNFKAHVTMRMKPGMVKRTVEEFGGNEWYVRTINQPFRNAIYQQVSGKNSLMIKEMRGEIERAAHESLSAFLGVNDKPFEIQSLVVGAVLFPDDVAKAQEQKVIKETMLSQKGFEEQIAEKDAHIRVKTAQGIADAQKIINGTLTELYVQHEAVEAQRALVGSPNHSVIYIPIGPSGVPLVKTVQ